MRPSFGYVTEVYMDAPKAPAPIRYLLTERVAFPSTGRVSAVQNEERKNRLVAIAARFHIAGEEAEELAHDVLSTFLLNDCGDVDADDRLDGLMIVTCDRRNAAAIVAGFNPVELRGIFPLLPAHTRRVLQLHIFERLDANGLAVVLNVSPTFAARLIVKSVERAKKAILERR
jgi:hypothetical protein